MNQRFPSSGLTGNSFLVPFKTASSYGELTLLNIIIPGDGEYPLGKKLADQDYRLPGNNPA